MSLYPNLRGMSRIAVLETRECEDVPFAPFTAASMVVNFRLLSTTQR